MSSVYQELQSELTAGPGAAALASQLGTDPETAGAAAATALPALLGALGRNASQPEGASALLGALQRDHDGGILQDLVGALVGGGSGARGGIGEAILGHVFGRRREAVEGAIGADTGLDRSQIAKLLVTLAPVVLGALGKRQRERGYGAQELSHELGMARKEAEGSLGSRFGPLAAVLDRDDDGRVDAGIARIGRALLGRLFRRR